MGRRSSQSNERLWRALRLLAKRARVSSDPQAEGPAGLWRRQASVHRVREKVIRLLAFTSPRIAGLKRRIALAKQRKALAFASIMREAASDPDLRNLSPAMRRQAAQLRLALHDRVLMHLIGRLADLEAIEKIAGHLLEHTAAAKETLRQQVDLMRDDRMGGGIRYPGRGRL